VTAPILHAVHRRLPPRNWRHQTPCWPTHPPGSVAQHSGPALVERQAGGACWPFCRRFCPPNPRLGGPPAPSPVRRRKRTAPAARKYRTGLIFQLLERWRRSHPEVELIAPAPDTVGWVLRRWRGEAPWSVMATWPLYTTRAFDPGQVAGLRCAVKHQPGAGPSCAPHRITAAVFRHRFGLGMARSMQLPRAALGKPPGSLGLKPAPPVQPGFEAQSSTWPFPPVCSFPQISNDIRHSHSALSSSSASSIRDRRTGCPTVIPAAELPTKRRISGLSPPGRRCHHGAVIWTQMARRARGSRGRDRGAVGTWLPLTRLTGAVTGGPGAWHGSGSRGSRLRPHFKPGSRPLRA